MIKFDLYIFTTINFFISFFLCISLIPQFIFLGKKLNLYDNPSKRKIHLKPLVFTGGICILTSSLLAFFINIFLNKAFNLDFNSEIKSIIICAFLCLVLGLVDDIFKISPLSRLFVQIAISIYIWSQGIAIEGISIFNNFYYLHPFLSLLVTLFWITGVINAFNWIDGMDGLAAGISSVSILALIIIFFNQNDIEYILFLCSLMGSLIGFLRFNFYPSKLIMGDSGSYFLGFTIACFGLISTKGDASNLYLPILLISVPFFDMIYVIFKRIFKKKSPFLPDKNHIHHRLLKVGCKQRKVLYYLYSFNILTSIICLSIFFLKKNL